ncbi:ABC transporter ATP-binding protein [Dactylosporangium sp. CA-092794]|uniref:ABC transporter ATP-binding protein n=1 Tax=Dactylosporangium sp. CA-092794 TaxID=3239929 RepID=UPI003D8D06D7
MESVLSAHELSSGYNRVPVVRDVTFHLHAGEVMALLGANGAGKSTLIMTLAGQIRPLSGEVRIRGNTVTNGLEKRVRDDRIAVLTQERCVFMTLTASQNIILGGGTVDEALTIFPELEPHLGRKVGHLSGGQQQMVSVARAICGRPAAILADEVSLGLAPNLVDRLLSVLSSVARDRGIAVLMVEQFVGKALHYSDRACVLSRGSVVMEGPSQELNERQSELYSHYV